MADIFNFPPRESAQQKIRNSIRERLIERGLCDDAIEWICSDIMPRLEFLKRTYSLDSVVPEAEEHVYKVLDETNITLMQAVYQMLELEIELYFSKFEN